MSRKVRSKYNMKHNANFFHTESIVTIAAKTETIATPVAGVYSPDANGRVGLLTWRSTNISS